MNMITAAIVLILGTSMLGGATFVSHGCANKGWCNEGPLDEPVSVRNGSTGQRRGGYIGIIYFGGSRRGHSGGGYGYGK